MLLIHIRLHVFLICVPCGELCRRCCKPYPWFPRITWFAWRFDAHRVIAMDIPIRHGYFVFRVVPRPPIMQSAREIAPLAQSIISIVTRIASWHEPYHYYGFSTPGAVSVMTRRNPKGKLPQCQAIFTAGSITHQPTQVTYCAWSIHECHRHWWMLEMSQNMTDLGNVATVSLNKQSTFWWFEMPWCSSLLCSTVIYLINH